MINLEINNNNNRMNTTSTSSNHRGIEFAFHRLSKALSSLYHKSIPFLELSLLFFLPSYWANKTSSMSYWVQFYRPQAELQPNARLPEFTDCFRIMSEHSYTNIRHYFQALTSSNNSVFVIDIWHFLPNSFMDKQPTWLMKAMLYTFWFWGELYSISLSLLLLF